MSDLVYNLTSSWATLTVEGLFIQFDRKVKELPEAVT